MSEVSPSSSTPSPGERTSQELPEMLHALPLVARLGWFALGAVVATSVTLAVVLIPRTRTGSPARAQPYESFPFTDNAGVCQEYVAIAQIQTSYSDAQQVARRLVSVLPNTLRAENLRVVHAFAPGDAWTIAVDSQAGVGTLAEARTAAEALNAIAATGVRFDPVFYGQRRLYDSAQVLCMPRQSATP